jgi:hypothetical protein
MAFCHPHKGVLSVTTNAVSEMPATHAYLQLLEWGDRSLLQTRSVHVETA